MADLAYITLPNNVTYNFKDANAVTLNTDQTITGGKTFNAIYFTNALYKKNSSNENAGYIGTVDGVVGSTSVLQQWYFAEKSYNSNNGAISSYAETYFLPAVSADRTADGSYNILTSKNAVTVAQGGTGATNASGAIANLGAVDLTSAQSISGKKSFTTDLVIKGNAPAIQQANSAGTVMAQEWLTNDTINNIMHGEYYDFQVYSYNSSNGAIKTYYERYVLPRVNADRTNNATYSILTSKNAVTIDQGGTGATSAAGAIANLGAVDLTSAQSISGLKQFTGGISLATSRGIVMQSTTDILAEADNMTENGIRFYTLSGDTYTGTLPSWMVRGNINGLGIAAYRTSNYRFAAIFPNSSMLGIAVNNTNSGAGTWRGWRGTNVEEINGTLGIAQGGTGATTAANARTALDVYATADSCKRIYFTTSANTQKNVTVNGQAVFLLVISCSYAACRTVAVGYVNTSKTAYVTSLNSNATGVTFTTSTAGKLGITTTYAAYCLIIPYMGIGNISV